MNGTRDISIVRSIVELGRGFGTDVVVEGIESEAICEQLIALDCTLGQGYLFARPMSGEEFTLWLPNPFCQSVNTA